MTANQTITTQRGDCLDNLLWKYRGRATGLVEQTLALNPGLAAQGPLLPEGLKIKLPPAIPAAPQRETVHLWS